MVVQLEPVALRHKAFICPTVATCCN